MSLAYSRDVEVFRRSQRLGVSSSNRSRSRGASGPAGGQGGTQSPDYLFASSPTFDIDSNAVVTDKNGIGLGDVIMPGGMALSTFNDLARGAVVESQTLTDSSSSIIRQEGNSGKKKTRSKSKGSPSKEDKEKKKKKKQKQKQKRRSKNNNKTRSRSEEDMDRGGNSGGGPNGGSGRMSSVN